MRSQPPTIPLSEVVWYGDELELSLGHSHLLVLSFKNVFIYFEGGGGGGIERGRESAVSAELMQGSIS